VHDALEGVDEIVHAGDIGGDAILYELETIAPVTAARGNCDGKSMAGFDLPFTARTTVAGVRILVIHDIHDLGPMPSDVDVVVCGHSHHPGIALHGRVLVVNPGSATNPRLVPGPSVALLDVGTDDEPRASIVMLDEMSGA
jgi:hypothetical protein